MVDISPEKLMKELVHLWTLVGHAGRNILEAPDFVKVLFGPDAERGSCCSLRSDQEEDELEALQPTVVSLLLVGQNSLQMIVVGLLGRETVEACSQLVPDLGEVRTFVAQ